MLNVVTYFWGNKYSPVYVDRLAHGLQAHLKQPYRFIVMSDRTLNGYECHSIEDWKLLQVKGCFARLRMFDPQWQEDLSLLGKRIVCVDLDTVITGPLDPLFDRVEPLVILQGANAANPCPYTACIFMLQSGAHQEVWEDFSLDAAQMIPRYEFPDDQGWLHFKVPHAAGWQTGAASGIWSFRKRGWPGNDVLPHGTRIVAFPGARDPSQFTQLPWVKQHWIC
jgi:hypothetical protein